MHNSGKQNINSFLHSSGMGALQELCLGHLQAIKSLVRSPNLHQLCQKASTAVCKQTEQL